MAQHRSTEEHPGAHRLLSMSRLFFSFFLLSFPLAGQVRFETKSDRVTIEIDGKPFSALHFGKAERKPFLHPLLTPSGKAITRGFPVAPLPGDPTDRPHQLGLAIGAEKLNGQDFWENYPKYGGPHKATILFKELTGVVGGEDRGTLSFLANWISEEGKLLIIEQCKLTFYSKPPDRRMFDVDLDLEAAEPLAFADAQDAILGLRLALPFDDHYGGQVVNAEGGINEDAVRGRRSPWLDWTADLDPREYGVSTHGIGEKVGVAVFDHPTNLNHPTRWHVRAEGVLEANPFARQAFDKTAPELGYTMKRGDKLHLRYRILIHPAGVNINDAFKEFAHHDSHP